MNAAIVTRLALLSSGILIGVGLSFWIDKLKGTFAPHNCDICKIKDAKIDELEKRLYNDLC
jgi:hypothetical protein